MIDCALAADISTTHVGYCLQNKDTGETLAMSSINLPSKDYTDIWEKVDDVKIKMTELALFWKMAGWNVASIYVEESLKNFKAGASSADVIVKLAQFNAMVSFLIRNLFGINPVFLNVNTARSRIGIKVLKKKGVKNDTKKQVLEQVAAKVQWSWPTKVLKSGPNKGTTAFEEEAYDMADSWVICKAGCTIYRA